MGEKVMQDGDSKGDADEESCWRRVLMMTVVVDMEAKQQQLFCNTSRSYSDCNIINFRSDRPQLHQQQKQQTLRAPKSIDGKRRPYTSNIPPPASLLNTSGASVGILVMAAQMGLPEPL